MSFWEDFQNPPVRNRIKPFWFWNGFMEEEEVKLQIREMADKGLGGSFLCARQGLKVPYLSEEWFRRVKEACEYARDNGLENWLYDEYPYPSGMSGGEVLLRHPESVHTSLRVDRWEAGGQGKPACVEKDLGWSEILLAKAIKKDETGRLLWQEALDLQECIGNLQPQEIYQQTGLTSYNRKRFFSYGPRHILSATLPEGDWTILIISQEALKEFKYYGGYFDPCSKEAVKTFLDTTHERYRRNLGKEFGRTIHGMFSDEVGLLGRLPWTARIWQRFLERNGYDLREALPALADKSYPDADRIRFDYFQTVHELFVDSYHRQVADWCGDHSLLYATEVPSMRMSTQRYSTVIGGDTCHEKLGRSLSWILEQNLGNYRANAKSVSALARQLDKSYAMIESFHSIGWSMTLQDAKWMVDFMGVCGINLFNFHAFYFTTDGIAKHDAPPSQFLQNPYWKHYRLLADYVARMSVFNTYTDSTASVAVLDPAASLFTRLGNPFHGYRYGGEDSEEQAECGWIHEAWVALCRKLLLEQREYDNLDTEILSGAAIRNGHIRLGRADYTTVLIPPVTCLEADAINVLTEFMAQGGAVILLGEIPRLVVGGEADLEAFCPEAGLHRLAFPGEKRSLTGKEAVESVWEELRKLLEERENRFACLELAQKDREDFLFTCRRSKDGGRYALAVNQGGNRVTGKLRLGQGYQDTEVYRLSLEDGGRQRLVGENGCVELDFAPYESYCLEIGQAGNAACPVEGSGRAEEKTGRKETVPEGGPEDILVIETSSPMKISIEGGNILRLEYFDLSLDGQKGQRVDAKTFIEQQAQLRQLTGEMLRYQGEFGTPKRLSIEYPLTAVYSTQVRAEELSGRVWLLMDESAIGGSFVLHVNDKIYTADDFEPFRVVDYRNRRCEITAALHKGGNSLWLAVEVEDDSCGIRDPLYLWGDFGVRLEDGGAVLTEMPGQAVYRDTFVEGFPFYSGEFTFEKNFMTAKGHAAGKRALAFDFWDGRYDCMEVALNGISLGVRAFTPYCFPIPQGALREGENTLILKVRNTLANMLDGTYFDYQEHKLVPVLEDGENVMARKAAGKAGN